MRRLIIWLVVTITGMAGRIDCGAPYTMVLDGEMDLYGVRQLEHIVLEKVHKRGGLDGRWKVTQWNFTGIMPYSSSVSMERSYRADMHHDGEWMDFHMSLHGNR